MHELRCETYISIRSSGTRLLICLVSYPSLRWPVHAHGCPSLFLGSRLVLFLITQNEAGLSHAADYSRLSLCYFRLCPSE